MKSVIAMIFMLAVLASKAAHVLQAKNSNEVLNHLQGNNYNVYILFFYDSKASDQLTKATNQDIENRLNNVLADNPEFFYSKIDSSDKNFQDLLDLQLNSDCIGCTSKNEVGTRSTPSILLIVHGKGVWLTANNSYLATDRLKDFLPAF